ncbi:DUF1214 domain-containing protein [Sphingomonas sp. 28-62-11]|uniref:DUF1214 domain-containing protein n=1 Tax=Sphingomonas sp. 28-62-11 TaxID=1970432 RepID=UPI000BD7BF4B|nr:MAG: hypothetical protein B7Y49_03030 [Sphingomonas sp. 28-62-11]
MKNWARLLIGGVAGVLIGSGAAIWTVRAGSLGAQNAIGPWYTGRDFGSEAASGYTRAVVALRGLLALPASEVRYYTAATDDAGQPLTGNCTYTLTGGALPAKWWSVTLYDRAGYLVPNPAEIYSVGSASLSPAEAARWAVTIAPTKQPGRWLPTGNPAPFELTMRAYLPADRGKGDFTRAQLPQIKRERCA